MLNHQDYSHLGKHESALEILWDTIRVRRGKSWSSPVEEAMSTFLKICLSLKSSQSFKDGANQYKILCQLSNVSSFETLMNNFFSACIEAAFKAKNESKEKVLAEDLDEIESPETIILKSISETTQKDRSDRALLSPILKFTWESFRNILEICKNNRNLEKIYCELARRTFKFLLDFERKTEFRKLCDVTKTHLHQTIKYTQNTLALNLNEPACMESQLEVRLSQLETAISMELWNEAYKTMEDIHFLLRLTKKTPHPKILAIFYQKLSLVFSKTNSTLFHAIALQKLFILIKEHKKGFKPEEMTKISSKVVAAAISVPLINNNTSTESLIYRSEHIHTMTQLSSILGLTETPTRESLIESLIKLSIINYADPTIINIFNVLNETTDAFNLCEYVGGQLKNIPPQLIDDLSPYAEPIKKVAFIIQLKKYSEFYEAIEVDRIHSSSSYFSKQQVMDILLECSRNGYVKLSIDGVDGIVTFEPNYFDNNGHYYSPSNIPVSIIEEVNIIYDEICDSDKFLILLKTYLYHGIAEYERYLNVKKNIDLYLEEVSRENEEEDKKMLEKMEEERCRMDKMASELMEEERRKRDEERQIRIYKENQLNKALEQAQELKNDIPVNKIGKNPKRLLNAAQELMERKIVLHVKKMKKTEKCSDTLTYLIRSMNQTFVNEYLKTQEMQRHESFKVRENELLTAKDRERELLTQTKEHLETCRVDVDRFVQSCKSSAMTLHQQSLDEFNDIVNKEREIIVQRRKPDYIKRKKLEKVHQLKIQFQQSKSRQQSFQQSTSQPRFQRRITDAFNDTPIGSGKTRAFFR